MAINPDIPDVLGAIKQLPSMLQRQRSYPQGAPGGVNGSPDISPVGGVRLSPPVAPVASVAPVAPVASVAPVAPVAPDDHEQPAMKKVDAHPPSRNVAGVTNAQWNGMVAPVTPPSVTEWNPPAGSLGGGSPRPEGRSTMDIERNVQRVNREYYDRRMAEEATDPAVRAMHMGFYNKSQAESNAQDVAKIAGNSARDVAGITGRYSVEGHKLSGQAQVDAAQIQGNTALHGADIHSGDLRFTNAATNAANLAAVHSKLAADAPTHLLKQQELQSALQIQQEKDPAKARERAAIHQAIYKSNPWGSMGPGMVSPVAAQ